MGETRFRKNYYGKIYRRGENECGITYIVHVFSRHCQYHFSNTKCSDDCLLVVGSRGEYRAIIIACHSHNDS